MKKIVFLFCLSSISIFADDYSIVVTGDPNFIICDAKAGESPTQVIGTPCSYSIDITTTSEKKKKKEKKAKITGELQNTTLPNGSNLFVQLSIDKGNGRSQGFQKLRSNKSVTLVRSIIKKASNQEVLYKYLPSVHTKESFRVEVLYTILEQ